MLLCALKIMPASLMLSHNSPKAELGYGLIRIIYSLATYALQQCIIPSVLANLTHYAFKTNNVFLYIFINIL